MSSEHLNKVDGLSCKTWLGIAAFLVMLCQLVAMALVVDRQMEKAQLRDARHASVGMAIASCYERSAGPARLSCIQQAQAAADPVSGLDTGQPVRAVATAPGIEFVAKPAVRQMPGILAASLATRQ
ncbi:hypothetical protein [Polaromonas jejuensis]|uniref:Uncharacterized protein n=1 Tax=Polaromonas jejuensis TaxID=457502 RepID=A0ABW0QBE6_9BURK|nr:hypothetical protein [Polaromonas jejuensis]